MADVRSHLTPSQIVEHKFLTLLHGKRLPGSTQVPVSALRMPARRG